MPRLVYRGGSATDDNLTPRAPADTAGDGGQSTGLSVFAALEQAVSPGGKAQVFDLELLEHPLHAFADDPAAAGGVAGHVTIAPVTAAGEIDRDLRLQWAAQRGTGRTHELTTVLRRALVQTNVKRPR